MLSKLQNIRRNAKKKGFTLVELIVVIIIIAIIAAVAIPRIAAFQDSAKKSRVESEHRQLVTAIQSFMADQEDPGTAYNKINDIETVKNYMNLNGKDSVAAVLAKDKDGTNPAHTIEKDNFVLKSTFVSSSGEKKEWVYNYGPNNGTK